MSPHIRKDGTFVQGHMRSAPNSVRYDNYGERNGIYGRIPTPGSATSSARRRRTTSRGSNQQGRADAPILTDAAMDCRMHSAMSSKMHSARVFTNREMPQGRKKQAGRPLPGPAGESAESPACGFRGPPEMMDRGTIGGDALRR